MLAQKHRINRRFFNDVFSKGQFFNGQHFSGKIISLEGNQPSRFAVVGQKKALKRAVDRNRLRRRVYGVIADLLTNIKPGFAIIIFVKPTVLDLDFINLRSMLADLFKHLNIYHD